MDERLWATKLPLPIICETLLAITTKNSLICQHASTKKVEFANMPPENQYMLKCHSSCMYDG